MALWCFNPHLTLGRVKSPANREKLAKMLKKLPPVDWPPFEVKELILFQSVLVAPGVEIYAVEGDSVGVNGGVPAVCRSLTTCRIF